MSNGDRIQKQMEFIVDQQAQFASDIGQLRDIVARLANASLKRIEDLEEGSSCGTSAFSCEGGGGSSRMTFAQISTGLPPKKRLLAGETFIKHTT